MINHFPNRQTHSDCFTHRFFAWLPAYFIYKYAHTHTCKSACSMPLILTKLPIKDHYILTEFPEGNISIMQKELITVPWWS